VTSGTYLLVKWIGLLPNVNHVQFTQRRRLGQVINTRRVINRKEEFPMCYLWNDTIKAIGSNELTVKECTAWQENLRIHMEMEHADVQMRSSVQKYPLPQGPVGGIGFAWVYEAIYSRNSHSYLDKTVDGSRWVPQGSRVAPEKMNVERDKHFSIQARGNGLYEAGSFGLTLGLSLPLPLPQHSDDCWLVFPLEAHSKAPPYRSICSRPIFGGISPLDNPVPPS
jgi:hypothetical protein